MTRSANGPSADEVLDAVLAGSRVLVGVAARSLAVSGEDVTLPQIRTLVTLAYSGAQRTVDLADQLDVNSSTATRMVDRLVRRKLVRREPHPEDGRATRVMITEEGREVVATVMSRRRSEFLKILRRMGPEQRRSLVEGLVAMNAAAGEAPEHPWNLGWGN